MLRTLFMGTANKSPEETAGEIQQYLKDYGLSKFMLDIEDGEIVGVILAFKVGNNELPYKLPINHKPLWEMAKKGEIEYIKTETQARRIAWRQVLKWIQAQVSLVEIGILTIDEVFLPYLILDKNEQRTVYELYNSNHLMLK